MELDERLGEFESALLASARALRSPVLPLTIAEP
jgi:hypothetical protein